MPYITDSAGTQLSPIERVYDEGLGDVGKLTVPLILIGAGIYGLFFLKPKRRKPKRAKRRTVRPPGVPRTRR